MVYITNKNHTRILPFDKPISYVKRGPFWILLYDKKIKVALYKTKKGIINDIKRISHKVNSHTEFIVLNGYYYEGLKCNECLYNKEGKCKFRMHKLYKKCPSITK